MSSRCAACRQSILRLAMAISRRLCSAFPAGRTCFKLRLVQDTDSGPAAWVWTSALAGLNWLLLRTAPSPQIIAATTVQINGPAPGLDWNSDFLMPSMD